jgi:hypothetical protein
MLRIQSKPPTTKGTNADGGAELTHYDHPAGGGVLAAGSLTFAAAMTEDKRLSRLVANFMNRALGRGV